MLVNIKACVNRSAKPGILLTLITDGKVLAVPRRVLSGWVATRT